MTFAFAPLWGGESCGGDVIFSVLVTCFRSSFLRHFVLLAVSDVLLSLVVFR